MKFKWYDEFWPNIWTDFQLIIEQPARFWVVKHINALSKEKVMASIFYENWWYDTKGAATVEKIGGKDGFFALDSVSWSAVRGVGIDVR